MGHDIASIEGQLKRIFADVFAVDAEVVEADDSPETIDEWDSVAHLTLVLALEAEFQVQFEAEEIPDLASFGRIRDRLAEMSRSKA